MTVYVDDMYRLPMGRFGRMKMSHMMADTEAELHAMADKLGLKREWYQGDHYDVSMSVRRRRALSLGAHSVTLRWLAKFAMERRRKPAQGEVTKVWIEEAHLIQLPLIDLD